MDPLHPGDAGHRTEKLHALSEPAVGELGFQDFLAELLDRVRIILSVDTATVLLLDDSSQTLVATASRGMEEEVRQGVRIPLGRGFVGDIAKRQEAVALNRVDEASVSNPIFLQKGIKAMLGVPLAAPDSLMGVLHVGRLTFQPFSSQDTELLEVVAERIGGAIRAQRLATERSAALILERSLMPTAVPDVRGLSVATRYVAAERNVGGDWYDVFTLPSGDVWLVAGDVAGHGLRAAAMMGRVRSALRSYALLGCPPDEVLDLTDRKIRHFESDVMVTVLCAVAQYPFEKLSFSSAGHPPPVLARPDGPSSLVNVPTGLPIGVTAEGKRYTGVTLEIPATAVLALYTDGLVERPRESLDLGLERLMASVTADDPDVVCQRMMQQLIGSDEPRDDVALVIARREGE